MKKQSVKFGRRGGELVGRKVVSGYRAFICKLPSSFRHLADEYLRAAEYLRPAESSEVRDDFSFVKLFLYCKSIELSLKAFLLAKDVHINEIKGKIGHNLERGMEEAKLLGMLDIVEVTCIYKEEVRKANYYYVSKQGTEYLDDYDLVMKGSNFPSLEVLSEFASMLVAKLEKPISELEEILVDKYSGAGAEDCLG